MRGEQPKNTKNQQRSVLISKREAPAICPVCPMVNPALLPRQPLVVVVFHNFNRIWQKILSKLVFVMGWSSRSVLRRQSINQLTSHILEKRSLDLNAFRKGPTMRVNIFLCLSNPLVLIWTVITRFSRIKRQTFFFKQTLASPNCSSPYTNRISFNFVFY